MSDAVICDRCGMRIDEEWTGPMFRIKNSTGTGGPAVWDLCPECHTEVRKRLWSLLRSEPNHDTVPEVPAHE